MDDVKNGLDPASVNGPGSAYVAAPVQQGAQPSSSSPTPSPPGGLRKARSDSNTDACTQYIGRICQSNQFHNSGVFNMRDTGVLDHFKGVDRAKIASAMDPAQVKQNILRFAGQGRV